MLKDGTALSSSTADQPIADSISVPAFSLADVRLYTEWFGVLLFFKVLFLEDAFPILLQRLISPPDVLVAHWCCITF